MIDSTTDGSEVGPGEKLWIDEQLCGGVREPLRAGWYGSISKSSSNSMFMLVESNSMRVDDVMKMTLGF